MSLGTSLIVWVCFLPEVNADWLVQARGHSHYCSLIGGFPVSHRGGSEGFANYQDEALRGKIKFTHLTSNN